MRACKTRKNEGRHLRPQKEIKAVNTEDTLDRYKNEGK